MSSVTTIIARTPGDTLNMLLSSTKALGLIGSAEADADHDKHGKTEGQAHADQEGYLPDGEHGPVLVYLCREGRVEPGFMSQYLRGDIR